MTKRDRSKKNNIELKEVYENHREFHAGMVYLLVLFGRGKGYPF